MKKVLCFGDILLRFSPDVNGDWLKNELLPVYMGGAELNVAHALAKWQVPVFYCSALPDNYMSRSVTRHLENNGVDVSKIITAGNKIGMYFLAQGTDLKHAEVIYDRAGSSTAELKVGQVPWDELLEGVSWFHFTAISPAISANLADVCMEALEAAKKKNITISVDLNYRAKLWKWGKQPADVMPPLVQYCDVVMGNIWAAERMLGITLEKDFATEKSACLKQAEITSQKIIEKFTSCTTVANTFRFDHEDHLSYYGTLYNNEKLFVSTEHTATSIVDKVGSGDCFMAALIYGRHKNWDEQKTIDFAAAAAVDKMFIVGDATTATVEEIMERQNTVAARQA